MAHEYIKESDTFSTNRNGTVPKPTAQDVSAGKVLGAGGNWVAGGGGGGGSSTLAGLDDTSITSPSDGQLIGYDGNTNKWKNINAPTTGVQDVKVDGQSVVDQQGVARVTMPSVPTNIDDLSNVLISYPDNGNVLVYRGSNSKWENESGLPYIPQIYSTEEREVGVWTNGKPLYQKTFYKTITSGSEVAFLSETDIPNVEKYTHWEGGPHNGDWNIDRYDNSSYRSYSYAEGKNLKIYVKSGTSSSSFTVMLTVWYTKTTDTPGSGKWTTDGVPTVHYSTTEKIIGTWIDGKPIYEKQFHITSITANDNWQLIENVAIKLLIDYECIGVTSGGRSGNQTSFRSDKNTPQIQGDNTNGNLYYALISGTSISELYITARYTKTTD